jgi:hypothetical protein
VAGDLLQHAHSRPNIDLGQCVAFRSVQGDFQEFAAMNRRNWFRTLLAALCLFSFRSTARSQEEPRGVATLTEQLRFGLKARRPVEFAFIELVVDKVEAKQLPRDLVLSMMEYAQKKNKERPYPYFEFGMKKRAAALGVEL